MICKCMERLAYLKGRMAWWMLNLFLWGSVALMAWGTVSLVCDPDPLPAQYASPSDILIDDSVYHMPPPEYKLVADSLFSSSAYQFDYEPDKAWRFVGIVTFADTGIVRHEGADVKRYWR